MDTITASQKKALVTLSLLPVAAQRDIVNLVGMYGSNTLPLAAEQGEASLHTAALLGFIPYDSISPEDYAALLVGLTAVYKDALTADWDADKYKLLLQRTAGLEATYAKTIADRVYTPDEDIRDSVLKFFAWLPDIGSSILDDIAKGIVTAGMNAAAGLLPKLFSSKGKDTLYEFLLLGKELLLLRTRAMLVVAGETYAGTLEAPKTASGEPDVSKLKDIATLILPTALKWIGSKLLGSGGTATGVVKGLLGMGDLEMGDARSATNGDDQTAMYRLLTSVAEAGNVLLTHGDYEYGDAMGLEALQNVATTARDVSQELGDAFDTVLDLVNVAAPLAGGALGGPGGAAVGGALGSISQAVKGARNRPKAAVLKPKPGVTIVEIRQAFNQAIAPLAARLGQLNQTNKLDHQMIIRKIDNISRMCKAGGSSAMVPHALGIIPRLSARSQREPDEYASPSDAQYGPDI